MRHARQSHRSHGRRSRLASGSIGLLLAAACRAPERLPPQLDEVELERSTRTIVHRERIDLYSPYDEGPSQDLAGLVANEVERVAQLFGDEYTRPLTLYLRAVDERERERDDTTDILWRYRPSLGGLRGATVARRYMVLFVPVPDANGGPPIEFALTWQNQTLRHELAHFFLYRLGVDGPDWLHEGLAEDVETMLLDEDGRLALDPLPSAFLAARHFADDVTLDELMRWRAQDRNDRDRAAPRRWRCQALVRFLRHWTGEGDWRTSITRVAGMSESEINALDPEFRGWLRALDPVARVRSLVEGQDPEERAYGAALLSIYAERDPQAMVTGEVEELALRIFELEECKAGVSNFLIFFDSKKLAPETIERLSTSIDPVEQLSALAIRARRGESVDLERARAIDSALSANERMQASIATYILFTGTGK